MSMPVSASNFLNQGEKILKGHGYPSLTYFEKGDKNKPLVIFVPGDSHLARISYGFSDSKKEDFLAHQLVQKGYSFLGASYPTDHPVYTSVHPEFSIQDWGKQVADLAKTIFEENPELSRHIVVAGWSMGGSIAEPIAMAAKANGIVMDCFIALDAVPGNPYIMQSGAFSPCKRLDNGLADRSPLADWCCGSIEEQNKLNGHEVVSPKVYRQECLSNIPVNIEASEYRYNGEGEFTRNHAQAINDSGVFGREANFPWIGMIPCQDPRNSRISLTDQSEWNRIQQFKIGSEFPPGNLSQEKYTKYKSLCHSLPQMLTREVEGNHFSFVGEKGAKATANQIEDLLGGVTKVKKEFQELTKE